MRIPSVPIKFGGETRLLVYDYEALAQLQDIAGTYLSNVATMKAVRAALWAGLRSSTLDERGRETRHTLSLIEVGNILSEMSADEVAEVVKAITEARGLSDPPEESRPTKATETPTQA